MQARGQRGAHVDVRKQRHSAFLQRGGEASSPIGEGERASASRSDTTVSTLRRLAQARGLPLAALAACLAAFAGLALDAVGGFQGFDEAVFDAIRSSTVPALVDALLLKASWLGDKRVVASLAALAVVALLLTRGWRPALLVAGSVGFAYLAAYYLKELFELPRPPVSEQEVPIGGYGFPSAHAALSVALYGSLAALAIRPAALLLKRFARPGRREFIVCAGAVVSAGAAVVLLVGISRVYSGAHYPADVLGGYLVGAVAILLFGMLLYPEHRRHSLRSALVAVAFRSDGIPATEAMPSKTRKANARAPETIVPVRPCLTCGALSPGSYCARHRRPRPDNPARGTGAVRRRFRERTLAMTGGRCAYCGSDSDVVAHHVVGLGEGGNPDGQGIPLCGPCHRAVERAKRRARG